MVFLSDYTLEKAELKPKILKLFCILRLHIFLQFAFQGQTFKFKSYLFHALASPTYCKELALHGFNPFNWTLPLPFLPFLCCFLQAVLPISFCDYYYFFLPAFVSATLAWHKTTTWRQQVLKYSLRLWWFRGDYSATLYSQSHYRGPHSSNQTTSIVGLERQFPKTGGGAHSYRIHTRILYSYC